MAYTAWSVVFGEQPTAAKWNQLGTNDAGFKDGTNIDNSAIIARHLAANTIPSTAFDFSTFLNNYSTGTATPTAAGSYTVATADLSSFPTGSKILLIGKIQWNKATGTPASSFRVIYNAIIANDITTTFSYAASMYDGRVVYGYITKVAGVNSATLVLNIDGAVTGAAASGNMLAVRVG